MKKFLGRNRISSHRSARARRKLQYELLEARRVMTGDYQNPLNPYDVNADGFATPLDYLHLVNSLNANPPSFPVPAFPPPPSGPYLDVDGNDTVDSLDVLSLNKHLNGYGSSASLEAEVQYRFSVNRSGSEVILDHLAPQIYVGEKLNVDVLMRDPRLLSPSLGLFSTYSDLIYSNQDGSSSEKLQLVQSEVVWLSPFVNGQYVSQSDVNSFTRKVSIGGFSSSQLPNGAGWGTVNRVPFLATSAGVLDVEHRIAEQESIGLSLFDGELRYLNENEVTLPRAQITVQNSILVFDDSVSSTEDTTINLPVLANDADLVGGGLMITEVTQPSEGGVVRVSADFQSVVFEPSPDYFGPVLFSYTATNSLGVAGVGTVTINVVPVNDAPSTVPKSFNTDEDQTFIISMATLIAGDLPGPSNESDQTLIVNRVNPFSTMGGRVEQVGGNIVYTPPADFNGVDTFLYMVVDDGTSQNMFDPQMSSGTVTLLVRSINDAPRVVQPLGSLMMVEDDAERSLGLDQFLFDPDVFTNGDLITYSVLSNTNTKLLEPTFGSGVLFIHPKPDQNGSAVILIKATDTQNESVLNTLTLTVASVNDAPRARGDQFDVAYDQETLLEVMANDDAGPFETDDSIRIQSVSSQSSMGGTVSVSNGKVVYKPAAGYMGPDQFTYVIEDLSGWTSNSAIVELMVMPPPLPSAVDDLLIITEDTASPQIINVLANDFANPGATKRLLSFTQPSFWMGTVTLNDNGTPTNQADDTLSFTAPANYFGASIFTYTMIDSSFDSNPSIQPSTATVTVQVTPVNDSPMAAARNANSIEDNTLLIQAFDITSGLSRGPGEDGQTLAITEALNQTPNSGEVNVVSGNIRYVPAMDFFGQVLVLYTVTDNGITGTSPDPKSASSTLTITIDPVNDAPLAGSDSFNTMEDSPLTMSIESILANDSPGPANEQTQSTEFVDSFPIQTAQGGVVTRSGDSLIYTPPVDVFGVDSFTYVISDNGLPSLSATGTVIISVAAVNDEPIARDDRFDVSYVQETLLDVLANDDAGPYETDDAIRIGAVDSSSIHGGTVTISNGKVMYKPVAGYVGPDQFTYWIEDSSGFTSNSAIVEVTVLPPPLPYAVDDSIVAKRNGLNPLTIDVLANDLANAGSSKKLLSVTPGSTGAVSVDDNGTPNDLSDDKVKFAWPADFYGTAVFTYTMVDTNSGSIPSTATVYVDIPALPRYQNPRDRYDVDADGLVSPLDALRLINSLNGNPPSFPVRILPPPSVINYLDVDGNDVVDGIDTLSVLNYLNSSASDNPGTPKAELRYQFYAINADGSLGRNLDPNPHDGTSEAMVAIGEKFVVRTEVRDLRTPNPQGAFSVYHDLNYYNEDGSSEEKIVVQWGEHQELRIGPGVKTGTFKLRYGNETTTEIPIHLVENSLDRNAMTQEIQSAIEGLSSIGTGNVNVVYDQIFETNFPEDGFRFDINFTNQKARTNIAEPEVVDNFLSTGTDPVELRVAYDMDPSPTTPETLRQALNFSPVGQSVYYSNAAYGVLNDTVPGNRSIQWLGGFSSSISPDETSEYRVVVDTAFIAGTTGVVNLQGTFSPIDNGFYSIGILQFGATEAFSLSWDDIMMPTGKITIFIPLTAVADGFALLEDAPTGSFDLVKNDFDGSSFSGGIEIVSVAQPSFGGAVSIEANKKNVSFTPSPDFFGTVVFPYVVKNNLGETATGTVTIDVTPVNDPPVAGVDSFSTIEDASVMISIESILSNDVPGPNNEQSQSIELVSSSAMQTVNGGVVTRSGDSLVYAPAANFFGLDSFTYTISDNGNPSASATGTIEINVAPVNDPPTIDPIAGIEALLDLEFIDVGLSNIGPGMRETGTVRITAASSSANVISAVEVEYDAPNTTGSLRLSKGLIAGTSLITVTVEDSGFDGDFATLSDNQKFSQSFAVNLMGYDFGDAPTSLQSGFASSYPTLLVDDGARHALSLLALGGIAIDAELDGKPSLNASADDGSGRDDENGITFPITNRASQSSDTRSSYIASSTLDGFIDAWVDFNQDGDWDDSGEKISDKVAVKPGTNLISYVIPAGSVPGTSYARFRISSEGGLSPRGVAMDGEVEDYAVEFNGDQNFISSVSLNDLGDYKVTVDNGKIWITVGGAVVWSVPASELDKLRVVDSSGSLVSELARFGGDFPGTINYEESNGNVELGLTSLNLNLTEFGAKNLEGVNVIDLRNAQNNSLTFVESDLAQLNENDQLLVRMEKDDAIVTNSLWKPVGGETLGDQWIQHYQSGIAILKVLSEREWRNETNRYDVDGDADLNPLDVLVLVNQINSLPSASTKLPPRTASSNMGFVDPDGDAFLTPTDVLMLINRINLGTTGGGEGEASFDQPEAISRELATRDVALAQLSYMPDWDSFLYGSDAVDSRQNSRRTFGRQR